MATLPALTAEQQAKAEEAAARMAGADKVGRHELCKTEDAVGARNFNDMRKAAKEVSRLRPALPANNPASSPTPPDDHAAT